MYNLRISGYCTTAVQLVSHPQSVVTLFTAPISSEKNGMANPTSLDKLPRKGGRCFALTSKFDDKTKKRDGMSERKEEKVEAQVLAKSGQREATPNIANYANTKYTVSISDLMASVTSFFL